MLVPPRCVGMSAFVWSAGQGFVDCYIGLCWLMSVASVKGKS